MHQSNPDSSREIHELEARLKQLQPQPCQLSAADILAAADANSVAPPPVETGAPWALLAATGLGGVALGVLLTAAVFLSMRPEPNGQPVAEQPLPTPQPEVRVAVEPNDAPAVVYRPAARWSQNDFRVAEQLGVLGASSGRLPPLSANSVARESLAKVDLASPGESNSNAAFASESQSQPTPTMRTSDTKLLLQDLLGV